MYVYGLSYDFSNHLTEHVNSTPFETNLCGLKALLIESYWSDLKKKQSLR